MPANAAHFDGLALSPSVAARRVAASAYPNTLQSPLLAPPKVVAAKAKRSTSVVPETEPATNNSIFCKESENKSREADKQTGSEETPVEMVALDGCDSNPLFVDTLDVTQAVSADGSNHTTTHSNASNVFHVGSQVAESTPSAFQIPKRPSKPRSKGLFPIANNSKKITNTVTLSQHQPLPFVNDAETPAAINSKKDMRIPTQAECEWQKDNYEAMKEIETSNQQQQRWPVSALPCTHLSKEEHDSCPTKKCVWNPNPKNHSIPTQFDGARMRPYSRTAVFLMRSFLVKYSSGVNGDGPDSTAAFRKYLQEFCASNEEGTDNCRALSDGEDEDELEDIHEVVLCGCENKEKHGIPIFIDRNNQNASKRRRVQPRKRKSGCGMGDFKKEWIGDYVAHFSRVWAEYEDSVAGDGERSTKDVEVREEIYELYEGFRGLKAKYRILDKIGEGTFSSVYKAVDTMHHDYDTNWCRCSITDPQPCSVGNRWAVCGVVALKRIYVTSSTDRILNELAMLKKLSDKPNVAGLISALRSKDQIIAVLPFYEFHDFRDFINENPTLEEIAYYMRALMIGLSGIHEENILHRDIKPTNFLYNKKLRTGVIVDFGLAQVAPQAAAREEVHQSIPMNSRVGYFDVDKRPSIRGASRAGTRGFRAPEVLLRVVHQTTAIDIWAAGVIMLCTVTKTYPYFNSPDDLDALMEISCIFGMNAMKKISTAQGRRILATIPISKDPTSFEVIVEKLNGRLIDKENQRNSPGMIEKAFSFLRGCMCLNVKDRLSATTALQHPFLAELP